MSSQQKLPDTTSSLQELPDTMKDTIKNITYCLIKIAEQKNIKHSLQKIDFLEKEGFYNDKPTNLFDNSKN